MQLCREKFKTQEKKIKKYLKENENYEKIINHIKQCRNFNELQSSPISLMYGFEALKYECNGYYSFNLSKKGGVIRLIFSVDEENNIINLEFISMDHYTDFKRLLK